MLLSTSASGQPLMSSPPATQFDFHRLRARVGDWLYVTDPDRSVKLADESQACRIKSCTIDGYRFTPKPGLKVERRGDSIWDGAVGGFLIGGLLGVTVGAEGCLHSSMTPCFVGNGLVFGALGAYWDWQHKGRTVVFLGGPQPPGGEYGRDAAVAPVSSLPTVFDFSALGLRPGDRVAITGPDGTQTTGPITALSQTHSVSARSISANSRPFWSSGSAIRSGTAPPMARGSR